MSSEPQDIDFRDLAGAADAAADADHAAGDALEQCLLWLLDRLDQPMSAAALRARSARRPGAWMLGDALEALEGLGLRCEWVEASADEALQSALPVLLLLADGGVAVFSGLRSAGAGVFRSQGGAPLQAWPQAMFRAAYAGRLLQVTPALRVPADEAQQPRGRFGHWFWGPLLQARGLYGQVAIAALLTNLFALSASVFSMIVYDRVMPNGAIETLTALVVGVCVILVSDFAIRTLRGYFLDVAGARADLVIADTLFEQILDMEMSARKGSVGQTANVIKEFETLREFLTSATLTTLIDLPFALLFLAVIWAIGGPLVYIPLLAAPLVIGVSLAVQPQLRRLVQTGHEDGQSKQSVVVETLNGLEAIKSLGAGPLMRRRWQDAVAHQSEVGLKTRLLAQVAGNTANLASQAVWVATVAMGVFLVRDGQIGSGAIVACSMLAGRTIAPLAQLAQLMTRLNQSLVSYRSLRTLMEQPREHRQNAAYLRRDRLQGEIELHNVSFAYPGQKQGGLKGVSLRIRPGERVAILGRVGSGKTTLSKLLLGLYPPTEGAIRVDGTDIRQIDPADLRGQIGAVLQDVWLMSGTVKQNIALGANEPSDEAILRASQVAGVHDFIAPHPDGYGLLLRERGEGLSGGQRQAIAIARALVGDPSILLLDEPTSAMDVNGERSLIDRLKLASAGKTLLVITHRSSLLDLVDRVIVIEGGRVVADGPKAEVLKQAAPPPQPMQAQGQKA